MSTCRAMRPLSLGNLGRGVVRRGLDRDAGRAWDAPQRAFCVFRTVQDIHNGLRKAFEIGETLSKRGLLPMAPWSTGAQAEPVLRRDVTVTRQAAIGANSRCYSQAAHPAPSPASASLSEQLRSVMRLLPHSVVVCTAMHGTSPRAMTMSSLTSLTLSPTPLVTFNVAVPSRTLDAIAASREFNIHILAGDESGAAVAQHFTRGNLTNNVFDGVDWKIGSRPGKGDGAAASPLLQGEGVLRVLRCRVLADAPAEGLMRVRDHVIVVGEVLDVIPGVDKAEFGLAYADRQYRRVNEHIEVRT